MILSSAVEKAYDSIYYKNHEKRERVKQYRLEQHAQFLLDIKNDKEVIKQYYLFQASNFLESYPCYEEKVYRENLNYFLDRQSQYLIEIEYDLFNKENYNFEIIFYNNFNKKQPYNAYSFSGVFTIMRSMIIGNTISLIGILSNPQEKHIGINI